MFAKETYVQRRALLKKNIGSGVLLFLGNDEQGLHYEDNTVIARILHFYIISACRLPVCRRLSTLTRTRRLFLEMN